MRNIKIRAMNATRHFDSDKPRHTKSYRSDSQEEINGCLNCEKAKCTNCIPYRRKNNV